MGGRGTAHPPCAYSSREYFFRRDTWIPSTRGKGKYGNNKSVSLFLVCAAFVASLQHLTVLAAASPSGKNEAEQSLEEISFSEAIEPQSPTKRGRLLSMARRDVSEEVPQSTFAEKGSI